MAIEKPFDVNLQFEEIKKSALQSIRNSFPIDGKRHRLILNDVWVDDNLDVFDLSSQKRSKMMGRSWATPVLASLELQDISTGSTIDKVSKIRLMDLPKITPRSSYIVEGNEYQVVNQLRLKPGVYTRVKENGELESKVNLAKGGRFEILMDPENGVFKISRNTANIKLYPVLRDLGISDESMRSAWGKDLFESNVRSSVGVMDTEIKKFQNSLMRETASGRTDAIEAVKQYLDDTKIDPETTKMTMGKSFTKFDADTMLATSKRLLQTARQEKEPDDRDSMVFKSIHSVEDFVGERLSLNRDKISKTILNKLDKSDRIKEIVSKRVFDDPLRTMFTSTSISAPTEQTNPLHMFSGHMKLTIMGEGGIQNENAVTDAARAVHPSEFGFVDPVMTPQSGQVGSVTRLAVGIKKRGNTLYTSVVDAITGKLEHIDAIKFSNSVVAFPDQYTRDKSGRPKPKSPKVKVMMQDNQVGEVSSSKVQYILVDPKAMFSISTNLIPFLNSTQGNRALMASSQYEQATGLKDREQPLVQVDTGFGVSAEASVGNALAHTSPISGVVDKIEDENIYIKDSSGSLHKIGIYKDFPLNQKTFMNADVKVSVGDKVKKGQLLADNNYTKDGVLSMGSNLRVAYVPAKGYNFEDGIVVSESAAKKLTSEHMHKVIVEISDGGEVNKNKFMAYAPGQIKPNNASKMDESGVIKEGERVEYGDIVIAYLSKRSLNPETAMISRLHKALVKNFTPRPEIWNYEFPGTVTKVMKTSKEVAVYIKTEEPATIGDKLSGRYGNKGIISKVLPDSEMPYTGDGAPVDMLLNPLGIPSRLNPSQVLETAASKIAEKTGEIYKVRNFSGEDNHEKVMADLKKHGIKDKEILYDPEDGKPRGAPIMVGKQFTLKLDHPVRKKFSARAGGAGSAYTADMQPSSSTGESGQSMDALTIYSMLAHGANANLKEMATYKSEKNDEFWRSLQLGHPLPVPKPTFAYEKFVNMLKASGVNVEKNGTKISLMPMTDNQVDQMSAGKLNNSLMLKGKNLAPEKGGLFDPQVTGGASGDNWSHIELNEPIPNPVFENAIKSILDIKQSVYEDIIGGKKFVDENGNPSERGSEGALTGGQAIKTMLGRVNVQDQLGTLRNRALSAPPTQLDGINKKIRYLKTLDENQISPTEYVVSKIPVIPPKFRPIYPKPDGSLMTSDANFLYKDMGLVNEKLGDLADAPDSEKQDLRRDLYRSMKALVGLGNPITYKDYRGFISNIKGRTQPKSGYFQSKLVSKRQEMSGRSTIIPEPALNVDEVGMPKAMAWEMYKPHIVRELVQRGYTPLAAQEQVKDQTPIAYRALEAASSKRPVILNRAPTLHKFSTMAFMPVLTDGKTIKIHPLVVKGFNADFDGDMQLTSILVHLTNDSMRSILDIYGNEYIEERKLTARMRETVPTIGTDGEVIIVDLQDFPHGPLINSKEGKNGRIDFFAAIPGTRVLAYDEDSGEIKWKNAEFWSTHYDREVEIVNLKSGRQIVSDDDPRAVYGIERGSLSYTRSNPADACASSMFVPRADRLKIEDIDSEPIMAMGFNNYTYSRSKDLKEFVGLTHNFGYFVGVMVGDGWCAADKGVVVAGVDNGVFKKFGECANELFDDEVHLKLSSRESITHGAYGACNKLTLYSTALSKMIKPLIGSGADNKHLPPFFFKSPREFRVGLFAGLMDTDGSISVSNAKNKPQLMSNYASNSLRLVREVKLLAASLGIKGRITTSKTPAGKPCWVLSFSNYDIKNVWGGEGLHHEGKLAKLASVDIGVTTALMKNDIVPISFDLAAYVISCIVSKRDADKDIKSVYATFSRAKKSGSTSRHIARKLFEYVDRSKIEEHADGAVWINIVDNDSVSWDQVESVEKTGIRETGYDLTVPGYETFMNTEGVVLSNTMAVHLPASEKARLESFKMLPTNNLVDPSSGDIMLMPQNEMILGLYFLTREGKKVNKSFSNVTEARSSFDNGEINVNSLVTIAGKDTTIGRAMVNAVLPDRFRDPSIFVTKKSLTDLLKTIAKDDKDNFGRIVDALKDLGNNHAFKTGFTVGMEDIAPLRSIRDKIMIKAENDIKGKRTEAKIIESYSKASDDLTEAMKKSLSGGDNSLYHMANSGSKGQWRENLQQIMTAPVLVQDHIGGIVPEPIKKSYSEGLDAAGYWSSMYAARSGTITKSLQTSIPGYFSKRMITSVMGNTITKDDCGTNKGIDSPLGDKDTVGRFLSGSNPPALGKRNDIVDSKIVSKARALRLSSINVRSPLACEAPEGTCSKCFGHTEEGSTLQVGDNAGAITATALTEPLVQMGMNAFHTGGIAGSGGGSAYVAQGYDRVTQILEMPQIVKGKATLSMTDGKVTKIEPNPAGGQFVWVNQKRHFIPPTRAVKVRLNQSVEKGDYLSDGVAKPQELLDLKGMDATRQYMTGALQKAYDKPIKRNFFESIVKEMTNLTRIENPGSNSKFETGDYAPLGAIDDLNKKGAKIIHNPILKGIDTLPLVSEDWIARLNTRDLAKTIREGASRGWSSDIHGTHPIPAYVYGAEFGSGTDGKY
jgi:DNA-directed RNA polymerase beta subunit/DNA-directed RNA polymerase beta' subunit